MGTPRVGEPVAPGNRSRGIKGIYHSVSAKWLQSYLDEWRYNHRDKLNRSEDQAIFPADLGPRANEQAG